jgi:hypothetical protein
MNAIPLKKLLSAIGDNKRSGKSYKARCPAHHDVSPNHSIGAEVDGTVLLRCHSGCSAESIVKGLGLTMCDPFPCVNVDITSRNLKKTGVPSTSTVKVVNLPGLLVGANVADFIAERKGGRP